ncbi:MAG: helix-turn-helix transcriptional regulator [Melioribacter sp.]|nr:helix-turn-helix transcriptional regulator [Melioribacter sp.]
MRTTTEKLRKLTSNETSKWLEKTKWRVANEKWLDKSAKIALTILRVIREKNISQKNLAEMLKISPQQINKILKGQENLTLETISKIEIVLGIVLSETPMFQTTFQSIPIKEYTIPKYRETVNIINLVPYRQMQEPISCVVSNDDILKRKTA